MSFLAGYRKMLGVTQTDMANRLGISKQAYYRKEKKLVPFSDKEKVMIKEMLIQIFPEITIDEIFFRTK